MKKLTHFYLIKNNGLVGLADENRNIILDAVYEEIRPFQNGIHAIKKNGKWGYVNHDGNLIIDFQFYDAKSFSNNLVAPVQITKRPTRWGLIDIQGNEIPISLPRLFSDISEFNEDGIAIGSFFGKKCILNEKGEAIGNKIYQHLAYDKDTDTIIGVENGEPVVIDQFGNIIVKPDDNYTEIYYKSDGMYQVSKNSKGGYMNEEGKLVIGLEFDENYPFSEGLAYVVNDDIGGYIDKQGQYVIPPQFTYGSHFEAGLACVSKGDGYYYIDKSGKNPFDREFISADDFQPNGLADVIFSDGRCAFIKNDGSIAFEYDSEFEIGYFNKNGIATFKCDDKMGMIDSSGNVRAEAIYDEIELSSEFTLHAFRQNDMWGYLDEHGNVAISPIYDTAFPFSESGYTVVQDRCSDSEYKLIDADNHILVQFPFNRIYVKNFEEDVIIIQYFDGGVEKSSAFKLDFSKLFSDQKNEFLSNAIGNAPFDKYQWISPFHQGEAIAQLLNHPVCISTKGKKLKTYINIF